MRTPQRLDFPGGPGERGLQADYCNPSWLDLETCGNIRTDDDGHITFPVLIRGARYMIRWPSEDLTVPRPVPRLDFTVGPGEAKDLGKVIIDYALPGQ